MTLNEAYIHTADDNLEAELIQEGIDESFPGSEEDSDAPIEVKVGGTYDSDQQFHDILGTGEVEVTKVLQDGTEIKSVQLITDITADGTVTASDISNGSIPGDDTIKLRTSS